ncbi:SP-RING zinc finger domain containing protein [Entamoeba histolytica HM-3:IMSS]|uniref:SP-RING zinc finger domain containing protein n=1 Tax=Entamoeba histolytica HM-3:IMSS TaxID=885315 RepID=M7W3Q7_ENTHI|nr:SP-RING zinc finger domain containing protein [Entamoeba histolytica HM-3:IMSS]
MLNAEIEVLSKRPSISKTIFNFKELKHNFLSQNNVPIRINKEENSILINGNEENVITLVENNVINETGRKINTKTETDESERIVNEPFEEKEDKNPKQSLVKKRQKKSNTIDPIIEEIQHHYYRRRRLTRSLKEVQIGNEEVLKTSQHSHKKRNCASSPIFQEVNIINSSSSSNEKDSSPIFQEVNIINSSSSSNEKDSSSNEKEFETHSESKESSVQVIEEDIDILTNEKNNCLLAKDRKRKIIPIKEAQAPLKEVKCYIKQKTLQKKMKQIKKKQNESNSIIVNDGMDMEMEMVNEEAKDFGLIERIPELCNKFKIPFLFFKSQHPLYKIKEIYSFSKHAIRVYDHPDSSEYYVRFINENGNDVFLYDIHVNGKVFNFIKPNHFEKEYETANVVIPLNLQFDKNGICNISIFDDNTYIVVMKCEIRLKKDIINMVDFSSHLQELKEICLKYQVPFDEIQIKDQYEDDDINISFDVPLICPIGLNRIENPVRGRACKHITCCDLKNVISCCLYTNVWNCPICLMKSYYYDLFIDSRLKYYLSFVPESIKKVLFIGNEIQIKNCELESEEEVRLNLE